MNDHLSSALQAISTRENAMLEMLQRWVLVNSFSHNTQGVNQVANLLSRDFAVPGLIEHRHQSSSGPDHMVWTTPGWNTQPTQRILLVGHHDTVFPPGTFESWKVEGDLIRGPGVLDMKGGLAIIHTAIWALAQIDLLATLPIGIVCVGDEEIGSPNSREITEQLARGCRGGLVFEAGRKHDAIITRRKGTGKFAAHVRGVAAHAGNHHADGVNAVAALAQFITAAQSITDYKQGITVNVGVISGGTSANTVPENANCAIDFRFCSIQDGQKITNKLDHCARRIEASTGARFCLTGGISRPPLQRSPASQQLQQRYAACAQLDGLGGNESDLIGGGSDANTVSAVGVPTIDGLGPRGRGFHTHDEYVEKSSLQMRANALTRFLLGWTKENASE